MLICLCLFFQSATELDTYNNESNVYSLLAYIGDLKLARRTI
jgi:hypothetical protein